MDQNLRVHSLLSRPFQEQVPLQYYSEKAGNAFTLGKRISWKIG